MVGINASLITFTPGTTISSSQVNANFQALAQNGVNNDGGLITTDGMGNIATTAAFTCFEVHFGSGTIKQFHIINGVGTVTNLSHLCTSLPTTILVAYTNGSSGASGSPPTHPCYAYSYGASTCSVYADAGYAWNGISIIGG